MVKDRNGERERPKCTCAMTAQLFLRGKHFTETASDVRHEKQGVVAEATIAARLIEDDTGTRTEGTEATAIGHVHHGGTGIVCSAHCGWRIAQLVEEMFVVGTVLFEAGSRWREPAGVHAGPAAERVDADTGIVGEGRQSGKVEEVGGFRVCIVEERVVHLDVILCGILSDTGIIECNYIDMKHGRE